MMKTKSITDKIVIPKLGMLAARPKMPATTPRYAKALPKTPRSMTTLKIIVAMEKRRMPKSVPALLIARTASAAAT